MNKHKIIAHLSALIILSVILLYFANCSETMIEENMAPFEEVILNGTKYKIKLSYSDLLEEYYQDYIDCISSSDAISFEDFCDTFYNQDELTITEFVIYLNDAEDRRIDMDMKRFSSSTSDHNQITPMGGMIWQHTYHMGLGNAAVPFTLDFQPQYGDFTFDLCKGDVLYEEEGASVAMGLQKGHIAVIEGKFSHFGYGDYWRVIEAIPSGMVVAGVVRSVLDDDRFISQRGYILTVPDSDEMQRQRVVNYCMSQLDKPYFVLSNIDGIVSQKPLTYDPDEWQCAALIWKAYYNQGIDLAPYTSGWNGFVYSHGVLPGHILNSDLVLKIENYSTGEIRSRWFYTTKLSNSSISIDGLRAIPPKILVIPSEILGLSVNMIDDYAFFNATNLTHISIPSSVSYIGNYAFENCINLSSISIPTNVPSGQGYHPFYGCTELYGYIIPDSITETEHRSVNNLGYIVFESHYLSHEGTPYDHHIECLVCGYEDHCDDNAHLISHNATTHTYECDDCTYIMTENHNFTATDVCIDCGFQDILPHTHSYTHYYLLSLPGKFGKQHLAFCACGASRLQACVGQYVSGQPTYCKYCVQLLTAGGGIFFSVTLPNGDIYISESSFSYDMILHLTENIGISYSYSDYVSYISNTNNYSNIDNHPYYLPSRDNELEEFLN